jgi:hypothetical protein
MPKISQSSEEALRMVLETAGQTLDGRLRKILEAQTEAGRKRVRRALPPLPDSAATTIHRMKVSLHGAKPPVWRRLEIPSGMGLDLVHEALQTAFGWYDCHHHQFETPCGQFGDLAQSDESGRDDESGVALAQVAGEVRAKIGYVYDFGDDWRHDLAVEAIVPAEPGVRYPRCTGGRGAAPEEDSGGIAAFNGEHGRAAGGAAGGPVTAVDTDELTSALAGLSSVVVQPRSLCSRFLLPGQQKSRT